MKNYRAIHTTAGISMADTSLHASLSQKNSLLMYPVIMLTFTEISLHLNDTQHLIDLYCVIIFA
jgi:hypothetical protein